jgi:hypothetical protein
MYMYTYIYIYTFNLYIYILMAITIEHSKTHPSLTIIQLINRHVSFRKLPSHVWGQSQQRHQSTMGWWLNSPKLMWKIQWHEATSRNRPLRRLEVLMICPRVIKHGGKSIKITHLFINYFPICKRSFIWDFPARHVWLEIRGRNPETM